MAVVDNLLEELSPRRVHMALEEELWFIWEPQIAQKIRVLINLAIEPMADSHTLLHVSLSKFMLNLYPVRL